MPNRLFDLVENNADFKNTVKIQHRTVAPNVLVIKQDEPHNEVFLIKKGKVRIMEQYKSLKDAPKIQPGLAELGEGDFFGEFCLFDDAPASANVMTTVECELIEIDKETLLKFLDENPEIGYVILKNMITVLSKRIRKVNLAVIKILAWGLKAHKIDEHLKD